MSLKDRSEVHAALGDEARLRLVDLLFAGDHTVRELSSATQMPGNLLAHHLNVLETAGVVERRQSEGDRRHRYVILRRSALEGLIAPKPDLAGTVVFVCSHNSARSQYAAAYWQSATGLEASSAGSEPSPKVNPTAMRVADERGFDLSSAIPRGYETVIGTPDLLISVCDRAREGSLPRAHRRLHWSIPDPVPVARIEAFRTAFTEIERRIDHLIG